jgi:hypothetical protein
MADTHICEHCGEREATMYDPNPYMAELYPELDNECTWWCDECYRDAVEEI